MRRPASRSLLPRSVMVLTAPIGMPPTNWLSLPVVREFSPWSMPALRAIPPLRACQPSAAHGRWRMIRPPTASTWLPPSLARVPSPQPPIPAPAPLSSPAALLFWSSAVKRDLPCPILATSFLCKGGAQTMRLVLCSKNFLRNAALRPMILTSFFGESIGFELYGENTCASVFLRLYFWHFAPCSLPSRRLTMTPSSSWSRPVFRRILLSPLSMQRPAPMTFQQMG